jgi:hypothetical protein
VADAWGGSWGSSWGSSWTSTAAVTPTVTAGGGGGRGRYLSKADRRAYANRRPVHATAEVAKLRLDFTLGQAKPVVEKVTRVRLQPQTLLWRTGTLRPTAGSHARALKQFASWRLAGAAVNADGVAVVGPLEADLAFRKRLQEELDLLWANMA